MEIIKNNIVSIIILFSLLLSNDEYHYKIKYFGIHVANCSIENSDTLIDNKFLKKIIFNVKTKPFFDFLFPINNQYSIILNNNNRILSFSKNTNQPKVENFLKTKTINDRVFYTDSNIEILPNYYNIFSVLYIIMSGQELPENIIVEREGLIYNTSIYFDDKKALYTLKFQKENGYEPIINHTDIFTWAVFMENSQNKIFINPQTKVIEKCIFSKGLTSVSAHLIP